MSRMSNRISRAAVLAGNLPAIEFRRNQNEPGGKRKSRCPGRRFQAAAF